LALLKVPANIGGDSGRFRLDGSVQEGGQESDQWHEVAHIQSRGRQSVLGHDQSLEAAEAKQTEAIGHARTRLERLAQYMSHFPKHGGRGQISEGNQVGNLFLNFKNFFF